MDKEKDKDREIDELYWFLYTNWGDTLTSAGAKSIAYWLHKEGYRRIANKGGKKE